MYHVSCIIVYVCTSDVAALKLAHAPHHSYRALSVQLQLLLVNPRSHLVGQVSSSSSESESESESEFESASESESAVDRNRADRDDRDYRDYRDYRE